jgi:hypothetical protein
VSELGLGESSPEARKATMTAFLAVYEVAVVAPAHSSLACPKPLYTVKLTAPAGVIVDSGRPMGS